MTVEQKIEKCVVSLGKLNRLRVGLENQGMPPEDIIFDMIAEKGWRLVFGWEIFASLLPENRFKAKEFIVGFPGENFRLLCLDELLGFRNPDYRFIMRENIPTFNSN